MRELAVQAQNGTLQTADTDALGLEFDAIEAELTRISANTTWAGLNILDGTFATNGIKIEVGAEDITQQIADMTATGLSLDAAAVTVAAARLAPWIQLLQKYLKKEQSWVRYRTDWTAL